MPRLLFFLLFHFTFARLRRENLKAVNLIHMTLNATSRPVYENLDTAFVNVAALLRYLQARKFTGRIHVELDEYAADLFLKADAAPRVRETDYASGRTAEDDAALQRLLVRAREAGGLVSVYEEMAEEIAYNTDSVNGSTNENVAHLNVARGNAKTVVSDAATKDAEAWDELARVSGELIAAVDRAVASTGADFNAHFQQTRLTLADDYPFLDPALRSFEYRDGGVIELRAGKLDASVYVSGVTECLRRVVDRLAAQSGDGGKAFRERVTLELAVLTRRRQTALARTQFIPQLDRIVGTRVM